MHIEPGTLSHLKLAMASAAAAGLLAVHAPALLRQPALWLRTLLAAACFTVFMQSFHMKVGPSELHFIGAMPIYLAFGLVPTLFGFIGGLLLQGLLFEPQDLVHWAVNGLSLVVPLLAVHHGYAKRLQQLRWREVLQLDARYYAGVTLMVGFWLSLGEMPTPVTDWLHFVAAYLAVVAVEPVVTLAVLALIARTRHLRGGALCFAPKGGR